MGNDNGYIKLWRSLQDDEEFYKEKFVPALAWIDLLLSASHRKRTFRVRFFEVTVYPGEMAIGIREFAERWHWGVNRVQTFLRDLENRGMIRIGKWSTKEKKTIFPTDTQNTKKTDTQNMNVCNIISICNWDSYQKTEEGSSSKTDTHSDTQTNTHIDTHLDTPTTRIYNTNSNELVTPSPEGVSSKKKKRKKKSEDEYTVGYRCRKTFEEYFKEHYGESYYYQAKDAAAMKRLIKKITFARKSKNMAIDDNSIVSAFGLFLQSIDKAWINDNFTVTIIDSQYNAIISEIKNKRNENNNARNNNQRRGFDAKTHTAEEYEEDF